jgi:hypothetical protein
MVGGYNVTIQAAIQAASTVANAITASLIRTSHAISSQAVSGRAGGTVGASGHHVSVSNGIADPLKAIKCAQDKRHPLWKSLDNAIAGFAPIRDRRTVHAAHLGKRSDGVPAPA